MFVTVTILHYNQFANIHWLWRWPQVWFFLVEIIITVAVQTAYIKFLVVTQLVLSLQMIDESICSTVFCKFLIPYFMISEGKNIVALFTSKYHSHCVTCMYGACICISTFNLPWLGSCTLFTI